MKPLTALIIDDEEHNRNNLKILLNKHCPDINIIGDARSVDEAFTMINVHKPKMIFLDVMMPEKSGFDLLKLFNKLDFEVIFVSAFNEYAVTAFEYNALGYILKPIDYNKLVVTVNKAVLRIELANSNNEVLQFIKTLDPQTNSIAKIPIHHNDKVVLLDIAEVVSIESIEGVCHITTLSKRHLSSKELKIFEGLLKNAGNFERINKSTLINLDHLQSYEKGETCVLQMINNNKFEVSRRKKTEILHKLRLL